METYDAIIVGAGHNGLIAAIYLAKAGYRTLVLERNPRVGGAIQSGEVTKPGFIHDVYSTNMTVFKRSPVYADLKGELGEYGLRFAASDKPFCNVFPDGTSLRVYRDFEMTLSNFRALDEGDARGWDILYEQYREFQRTLFPLYSTPLPSADAVWKVARATATGGVQTMLDLGTILLSSTRELGEAYFSTEQARALMASWGLYLDYGPDISGGSLFPFMEAFMAMEEGTVVVEGGASRFSEALHAILRKYDGEVFTESEVTGILTEDGAATGVELADGSRYRARRAVVANVVPSMLFGKLLHRKILPEDIRKRVSRYQHGPATMMIHLALDGPAPWAAGEDIKDFGLVHVAPYVNDLAEAYTNAQNGLLPESPPLMISQTTAIDSSRTPGGEQLLWIQVRPLPRTIRGDAAHQIDAGNWEAAKHAYAERVLEKLEGYAPGLQDRIIDHAVFTPSYLEKHNPNLVGGDTIGGSHHLNQHLLFRPFPGWSRYKMPLDRLYMVGAGTWPGAGNHGVSGYLAAKQITRPWENAGKVLDTTAAGIVATAAAIAGKKWYDRRG